MLKIGDVVVIISGQANRIGTNRIGTISTIIKECYNGVNYYYLDNSRWPWAESQLRLFNKYPDACINCDMITSNPDHVCCECHGKK